jgi:hypothetical protein
MERTDRVNDTDRNFYCIITRLSTTLSLEERSMSSQKSLSFVPVASSIRMYSDPKAFCATPLQDKTLGVGMLRTMRT